MENELGEDEFYQQELFLEEENDNEYEFTEGMKIKIFNKSKWLNLRIDFICIFVFFLDEDQVDSDFDLPEDEPEEEDNENIPEEEVSLIDNK